MKIELSQRPGYLLLTLTGSFDGNWALTAGDRVDSALQEISGGAPLDIDLIIDLTGVTYISSGALRVLLALDKKMKGAGRRMALCNPSPKISEVFKLTGMYEHFGIYPSVGAAANHLRSP